MDIEPVLNRDEPRLQDPLIPLQLDVSGDLDAPKPTAEKAHKCACCGYWAERLWQGARAGNPDPHAVCTLCYLAGHLDSPTAAHGRLAFLPGVAMPDVHHLQRRAMLALLTGSRTQRSEGQRVMRWMMLHSREMEARWDTSRAGEFAHAMNRLVPGKRKDLRNRLSECALILPADVFSGAEGLSLLLPAGKTAKQALSTLSWETYVRSDLYV